MKNLLLLFIFLLGLLACSDDEKVVDTNLVFDVMLGDEFTVEFNKTRTITLENLTIKFSGIEDFRCPAGSVYCSEGEGFARAEFIVTAPHGNEKSWFSILASCIPDDDCSEEQEVLGYTIKLISIEPYPEGREAVGDSNYSVKMMVNR